MAIHLSFNTQHMLLYLMKKGTLCLENIIIINHWYCEL